jgi:EAL domain-containing protein (putative c-di-GMP-specific phosphodiesterase class I)/CheY-like chemotaxis protein
VNEQTVRVLIADDDPAMRATLADLIASHGSFTLVGAARDADEAIALAESKRPDVALVDVRMPAGGGQRVVEELRSRAPEIRVLAYTVMNERESVVRMLHGGAVGYLIKGSTTTEILGAIRRAARGQPSLSPEVMSDLVAGLADQLEQDQLQASERRAKQGRLARVIAGRGRTTVFQPIVELTGYHVVGFEALSRFDTDHDDPWPVDRWFSEAAAIGLGTELELACTSSALAELSRIQPGAYLSLNLSHRTLESPNLLRALDAVDSSRVVVEITEHEAVEDYENLVGALGAMRERGIRVAIDDVGAGFASLRHILSIEPDIIKLDVSLVRGIDSDPRRHALANALVTFAEDIGIAVVAEGIETADEQTALQALGIGFGQGYFIARPAPLETFAT